MEPIVEFPAAHSRVGRLKLRGRKQTHRGKRVGETEF